MDTKHAIVVYGTPGESEEHLLGRWGGEVAKHGRSEVSLRDVVQAVGQSSLADLAAYFRRLFHRIETYPANYLLVDALLSHVGQDISDALLFEDNAFHVLQYDSDLHLLLQVILQEAKWSDDPDVNKMIAHLLQAMIPPSLSAHINRYGDAHRLRVERAFELMQAYPEQ